MNVMQSDTKDFPKQQNNREKKKPTHILGPQLCLHSSSPSSTEIYVYIWVCSYQMSTVSKQHKLRNDWHLYPQGFIILKLCVPFSLLCLIKQENVNLRKFSITNELQNLKCLKVSE